MFSETPHRSSTGWLAAAGLVGLAACSPVTVSGDGGVGGDGGGADGAVVASCDDCSADATCDSSGPAIVCNCNDGFTGDGVTCTDVDECATDNGGCSDLATCHNQPGSRTCTCNPGNVGDGLTCTPAWELLTEIPSLAVYQGFGIDVAATNGRIYFAPESNDNSFFVSIGVADPTVVDEAGMDPTTNDFCACGFGGWLTASGADLFYFANWGQAYHNGAWQSVPYPNNRGEAATAAVGAAIYMVGGRGPLASVERYSGGLNGTWAPAGTVAAYPWATSNAAAAAHGGRLYVFGGDETPTKTAAYDPANNTWTPLPDLPMSIGRPTGAGSALGRVFVTSTNRIYFYDPGPQTWSSLALPAGDWYASTSMGGEAYLVGQAGTATRIYHLLAVP